MPDETAMPISTATAWVALGTNLGDRRSTLERALRQLASLPCTTLEAASGFGDMFDQLGFTNDQATKMSRSVVQMSADLGSFNNLPTADVAERIAAGFRGEFAILGK